MVQVSVNAEFTEPAANRGKRLELAPTLALLDENWENQEEKGIVWVDVTLDEGDDVAAYRTAWVGLANEQFRQYDLKLRTRVDGNVLHGRLVPRPTKDEEDEESEESAA